MVIGIPGVNDKIFLDLFDNDIELFSSVLQAFVGKTAGVLNSLRNVSQDTLADYTNNIHALKGACANICAEEARETAEKLEMMAKAGDISGILVINGDFLKYMEDMLDNLKNWLKNHQS
ncbi:MAG: Hpt domain-containing protein [Treponema sp.]|jgi:HPt (histidine-containing phosphotransfer) domain-containing protein|nr:Hpt domain-containing protein [Treponema sp.]